MAGIGGKNHWTLIIHPPGLAAKTLMNVQGEASLGEFSHQDRDLIPVMEQDLIVGHLLGEQRAQDVTWQALVTDEVREWCDCACGEGPIYGPGGTTPTVTADAIGEAMGIRLQAIYAPPKGVGKTYEWADAKLRYSDSGASPSVRDLTFTCIRRVR